MTRLLCTPCGRPISRRDLLRGAAALSAGAMLLPRCGDEDLPLPPATYPGRVVEVRDDRAVTGKTIDRTRAAAMLTAGLTALTGAASVREAWQALLPDYSPSMRIGLKLNCLSAYLPSSPELVAVVVDSLKQSLGMDPQRILVWDRRTDELTRSKIDATTVGGARVLGTVTSTSDASGPGYESASETVAGKKTHLSRILTRETDATINLALLKTHTISGITGAMKNTYGCIDNPGDFHTGLNNELPLIYSLSGIRNKMRLHLTEGLLAVIKGDTSDPPDATPMRLLLATDPLALDTRAVALVNELRAALTKPAAALDTASLGWLAEAGRLKIGESAATLKTVTL